MCSIHFSIAAPVVFQNADIAELQVGGPRNDDAGIGPAGNAVSGGSDSRRNVGKSAGWALRIANVGGEFAGESRPGWH